MTRCHINFYFPLHHGPIFCSLPGQPAGELGPTKRPTFYPFSQDARQDGNWLTGWESDRQTDRQWLLEDKLKVCCFYCLKRGRGEEEAAAEKTKEWLSSRVWRYDIIVGNLHPDEGWKVVTEWKRKTKKQFVFTWVEQKMMNENFCFFAKHNK